MLKIPENIYIEDSVFDLETSPTAMSINGLNETFYINKLISTLSASKVGGIYIISITLSSHSGIYPSGVYSISRGTTVYNGATVNAEHSGTSYSFTISVTYNGTVDTTVIERPVFILLQDASFPSVTGTSSNIIAIYSAKVIHRIHGA
jgi:hypothetical protein